jgi:hypothetical protein
MKNINESEVVLYKRCKQESATPVFVVSSEIPMFGATPRLLSLCIASLFFGTLCQECIFGFPM